jgi:photosystem II stability/assembly factor-like uncharacterized protein
MRILVTAFLCLSVNSLFADWALISSHPSALVRDILVSGTTIYTVSTGGVHKSTDGTATWLAMNNGLTVPHALNCYQLILFNDVLYIATEDGVYKSTNGGTEWVKKSSGIVVGGGALYAFCKSIFENSGVLYTGSWTGIYRSTNLGETWSPTNISGSGILACYFINYNGILFGAREVGNPPGAYKSTDNGLSWTTLSISQFFQNLPVITYFDDGPRLYAGTIHGVWLSTNSGIIWVMKNSGLSPDPYSSSIIRANGVLVTSLKFGGSGMFKSFDNGDNWIDFKQGLPFLNEINRIIQFNNKILAGTSDGIYQRDVSELTGIIKISGEAPEKFELNQNYPNPFNPETMIKFTIPDAGAQYFEPVQLIVYNINGQRIQSLVNQQLQPGTYEVTFDGSNFPSGVYYYKLFVVETTRRVVSTETKKMVLVK